MINNINFKKWLVKSEAIEYQPENWMKFHRQMTNKFKKFEEKYTQEFFQKIKKEIKRLEDDYCSDRERNFLIYAGSYVSFIAKIFEEDLYKSASNEMEYIANSKCGELTRKIDKYNSVFVYAKDDTHYREYYEEFLNEFESQTSYRDNCGEERYEEVMTIVNTVKKLVSDFDEYINNTKIVTEKHKIRCYVYYKRYDKGGSSYLKDRIDFPPHQDVEYLYHATSNLPAILSQGFKYTKELDYPAGLGGSEDYVISFTSNPNIAKSIASLLKQSVKIAKGEISSEDIIKRYKRLNLITDEDIESCKINYHQDDKKMAFCLFIRAMSNADEKGLRYNPFGTSRLDPFFKTNINDIGVIKAKIDMSKVRSYLPAEEEYRIPKEAIMSFEKYQ